MPELQGFNFVGGAALSPEFAALLIGLATYTAAFIAEIVRAGVLAVDRGQGEAAHALGLSRAQTTRLIILPQALRVIVPPMTSQYLNLTKNSSLAVAIGYPDLVSIANTTMNQTGQAIEGIAIIMAVYLTISLSISAFMNWYNARVASNEAVTWARANLFGSWPETLATLLILWLLWKTMPPFIDWAFLDAVWQPDAKACRAGEGACWGFIAEKHRFILFGTYPYEQHWRPGLASVLLIGLWVFSAIRRFWRWWLALVWLVGLDGHRRSHVGRRTSACPTSRTSAGAG